MPSPASACSKNRRELWKQLTSRRRQPRRKHPPRTDTPKLAQKGDRSLVGAPRSATRRVSGARGRHAGDGGHHAPVCPGQAPARPSPGQSEQHRGPNPLCLNALPVPTRTNPNISPICTGLCCARWPERPDQHQPRLFDNLKKGKTMRSAQQRGGGFPPRLAPDTRHSTLDTRHSPCSEPVAPIGLADTGQCYGSKLNSSSVLPSLLRCYGSSTVQHPLSP